jgi:hypothetical protein
MRFSARPPPVPIHHKESKVDMVFSFGLGIGRLKHAYQLMQQNRKIPLLLEQRQATPPGGANNIEDKIVPGIYTS